MNHCIFCGPTSAAMSAEHIYSNWISRKLRAMGVTGFRSEKTGKKRGALDTRTRRVVCEPCNNEWLADNERRFMAPFFFDLVRGVPTVINETLQVVLTFWLTRLAMAYEFVEHPAGADTFFTQSEREKFRLDITPPSHTRIWIASYNSGGPFFSHVGAHYALQTTGNFRDAMLVVTGVVGCFAYQLFSRRWLKDPLTEVQFDLGLSEVLEGWENATIPIWPETPDLRFSWPTPPLQGRPGLEAFADRFGGEASE